MGVNTTSDDKKNLSFEEKQKQKNLKIIQIYRISIKATDKRLQKINVINCVEKYKVFLTEDYKTIRKNNLKKPFTYETSVIDSNKPSITYAIFCREKDIEKSINLLNLSLNKKIESLYQGALYLKESLNT